MKPKRFNPARALPRAPIVHSLSVLLLSGLVNVLPASGQAAQPEKQPVPAFEVASVKPDRSANQGMMIQNGQGGRLVAKNVPLNLLVRLAYKVQDFQVVGAPAWAGSERYDIEAKPEASDQPDMRNMTDDQREAAMDLQRQRLQALLADRFKLTLHRDTKELPVYALVVAKNGPKLKETSLPPPNATAPEPPPPGPGGPDRPRGPGGPGMRGQGIRMGRGELSGNAVRMNFLIDVLSNQVGRTVIDKTGLKGLYDFTLKWTPEEGQGQMFRGPGDGAEGPGAAPPPPDANGPSIFTAIQEQLGLKLESQKGPVEVLVIDHVERPTEN